VINIRGQEGGVTFGKYNLVDVYDKVKLQMGSIEGLINQPNYQDRNLMTALQTTIDQLGKTIYLEVLRDLAVRDLFNRSTRRSQDSELSISFKMDKKFINLPVEFMLPDESKFPLAVTIPIYKTLTTDGNIYQKNDLDAAQELNILLVSSNTRIKKTDKIMIAGEEKLVNFTLPDIIEVDNRDKSEIEEIEKILINAQNKGKGKIKVNKIHTDQIDYQSFLNLIASDTYHIIHYNGHGYADLNASGNSYIFFWEKINQGGKVIALDANKLGLTLLKTKNLKLFYLSSCQGAAAEDGYKRYLNGFVGMLDAVASAGIPNALGMRWPISISNSKKLACKFYDALFFDRVGSIEAALMNARGETYGYDDKTVWCSPVLIKQTY